MNKCILFDELYINNHSNNNYYYIYLLKSFNKVCFELGIE